MNGLNEDGGMKMDGLFINVGCTIQFDQVHDQRRERLFWFESESKGPAILVFGPSILKISMV